MISGGFLGLFGSQGWKMRKIKLLVAAKARKCTKLAFWWPPGDIWQPRHENVENEPSGIQFGSQG